MAQEKESMAIEMNPQEFVQQAIDILSVSEVTQQHFHSKIKHLQEKNEQWNSASWRVGLIGITSSGKSTLVNGLLGEQLLPSAVKPSTNCLIMIRKGAQQKVIVTYENGKVKEFVENLSEEINKIGNELKNPINSQKILQLSVFSKKFKLNQDITLCDTPGLEAYNMPHHDEITLSNILPWLDLVLYVSTIRLVGQENSKIIQLITDRDKPLICILNCSDSIQSKVEKDGVVTKKRDEVAKEHKLKFKNNLIKTNLIDVSKVPIILVSAKQSLDHDLYGLSGLDELIATLHGQISKLSPKFLVGRLKQLDNELVDILEKECYDDSTTDKHYQDDRAKLVRQQQELNSLRDRHKNRFEYIYKDFEEYIPSVNNKLSQLTKSSVNEANTLRNEVQKSVNSVNHEFNKQIVQMNNDFKLLRKKHNILNEDFFYKPNNGAPSNVINPVEVDTKSTKHRIAKEGFGNELKRKVDIFKFGWGYEIITTKKSIIKNLGKFRNDMKGRLESDKLWLLESKGQSQETLCKYSETINSLLNSQIQAIDEAIKHLIPLNTKQNIILDIKNLKKDIESQIQFQKEIIQESNLAENESILQKESDSKVIELHNYELSLIKFLNSVSSKRYQYYFEEIMGNKQGKITPKLVVWHWDQDTCREVWERFFPQYVFKSKPYQRIKNREHDIITIDGRFNQKNSSTLCVGVNRKV